MKKVLSIALLFAAASSSLNAGPKDWNFRRIILGTAATTGTYFSARAALKSEAGIKEKVAYGAAALASTYGAIRSFKGAFSNSVIKRDENNSKNPIKVADIQNPVSEANPVV